MIQRLSKGDVTVMAGLAVVGYTDVIKRRTSKVRGVEMASIAFLVNGTGWYVIKELAHTDYIVVARRAVASSDTDMIIGARAKCSRGMANTAVLIGRHVFV